jgi:hypothetical protein
VCKDSIRNTVDGGFTYICRQQIRSKAEGSRLFVRLICMYSHYYMDIETKAFFCVIGVKYDMTTSKGMSSQLNAYLFDLSPAI